MAAAVVLLAPSKQALACSLPACSPPVRLAGMEYVPGNLVYFEVTADTPGTITLRTEAGDPIPASIRTIGGDRVFAPDAPIAPETNVVLEYEEACYGDVVSPAVKQFAFRTMEHLPITLQPARLFVAEYGVASPGVEDSERAFVRVELEPSAGHAAEHLLRHTLTIDGQRYSTGPLVGSAWRVGVESACQRQFTEIQYSPCGGVSLVPEGRHTLVLQTHIVGDDTSFEPLTLEVETRCPGTEANADGDPEPAPGGPDAGQADPAPSHGFAADDIGDPVTPDATGRVDLSDDVQVSSSCALSLGHETSSAAGAALLALAALGVGRRRRAQRS